MSSETSKRDHARELLAADKKLMTVARSARRRRLELRRLGRTASAAAEDEGAKRVRPAPDSSSDSSDSAKVAPEPPVVASRCSACVSHGAVSVIGRRREMEDAVAVAAPFLAETAGVEGSGDVEYGAMRPVRQGRAGRARSDKHGRGWWAGLGGLGGPTQVGSVQGRGVALSLSLFFFFLTFAFSFNNFLF